MAGTDERYQKKGDVQVGDDGAFVGRVDGVGRVSCGLVEGVVPLRRTIDNEHKDRRMEQRTRCARTSAVTVAPAGTSITAWDMGWW